MRQRAKRQATAAAEREPASREKRQQQDKPLKGYQDMTSSAPRQIGKGYKREIERKRENELRCDADKHTQIQLNSPRLTPSSVLGLSASAWAQFTNPN